MFSQGMCKVVAVLGALILAGPPAAAGQASCSGTIAGAGANCNCSLCTAAMASLCCAYSGIPATLLAFEEDDLWIPRLEEFNGCTGAKVTLTYTPNGEDGMQAALESDVGVKYNTGDGARFVEEGAGIYDSYIVQAPWMPAIEDGLEDLRERIAAPGNSVNWLDINPQSRQIMSYNGSVRALPLDVDYIAVGYREDVFQRHGKEPPKTMEELVALSEFFSGKDHNNDGVPDWGFCLTPQPNYFYAFVTPIMQRYTQECASVGHPPVCSGDYTGQNAFFDVKTFEPFLDNPGFRYAVDLHRRFLRSSNCPDQVAAGERCHRKPAMQAGRCAGVISMPGTMTRMLKPWDAGGSWAPQPRYASDGVTVQWQVQNASDGTYWGRRTKFPGSAKVYANGVLQDCTKSLCPKASEQDSQGTLINYAPFFAEGGEAYAMRAGSPARKKDLMFSMFQWLASLPHYMVPLSGVYRESQLTDQAQQNLIDSGWPQQMAIDLHQMLKFYFKDPGDEGGNCAQDLLILGFSEYMNKFNERIYRDLLLQTTILDGTISEKDFETLYRESISNLLTDYEVINNKYGLVPQLQRWRGSLGLPTLSKTELCETFAKFSQANSEALLRSGVDCSPPAGSDDNSDYVLIALIVLGSLFGGAVLFGALYWLYRTVKTNRRLRAEEAALVDSQVEEAKQTVREIQAPMVLMKAVDFQSLGKPVPHETARNQGKLHFLDTMGDEMMEFMKQFTVVFFSHQWLAWEEPDPTCVQYQVMVKAVDDIVTHEGISIDHVYVWYDWFSIPQACSKVQRLTINSLPNFASVCAFFVVVAPDAKHFNTGRDANLETYHSRCWCRAEVMSHWAKKGSDKMFYATAEGLQLMAPGGVNQQFMNSLKVFQGHLTCCDRKHPDGSPCDREALMSPMLGLYSHIRNFCNDPHVKGIYDAIEPFTDEIFPSSFTYVHPSGTCQRNLFGDLIAATNAKTGKGKAKMAARFRPGTTQANHTGAIHSQTGVHTMGAAKGGSSSASEFSFAAEAGATSEGQEQDEEEPSRVLV